MVIINLPIIKISYKREMTAIKPEISVYIDHPGLYRLGVLKIRRIIIDKLCNNNNKMPKIYVISGVRSFIRDKIHAWPCVCIFFICSLNKKQQTMTGRSIYHYMIWACTRGAPDLRAYIAGSSQPGERLVMD